MGSNPKAGFDLVIINKRTMWLLIIIINIQPRHNLTNCLKCVQFHPLYRHTASANFGDRIERSVQKGVPAKRVQSWTKKKEVQPLNSTCLIVRGQGTHFPFLHPSFFIFPRGDKCIVQELALSGTCHSLSHIFLSLPPQRAAFCLLLLSLFTFLFHCFVLSSSNHYTHSLFSFLELGLILDLFRDGPFKCTSVFFVFLFS